MEDKIRIRKVDVEELIIMLEDLFYKGINFIDIIGKVEDDQDRVCIAFSKSYMDEEFADNFDTMLQDEEPNTANIKIELSDEDLNQLI